MRSSSSLHERVARVNRVRSHRTTFALALVASLMFGVLVAAPALADDPMHCQEGLHDSSQNQVVTILNHSWTPNMHRAAIHTGPDWAYCDGPYVARNIVDVYIATYADKLVNGSWKNCSKNVRGWRGANVGWNELYVATVQNTDWYSGPGSCQWGQNRVRSRGFGKSQFQDGHILKTWSFNPGHAPI